MSLDDLMIELKHLQGQHPQSSHAGSRGSSIESIKDQLSFPYLPDEPKIDSTIQKLSEMKSLSKKKVLDAATELGVSDGFAIHVADVIKADRKSREGTTTRTPQEAREDRILRIRSSTGRATARRMR